MLREILENGSCSEDILLQLTRVPPFVSSRYSGDSSVKTFTRYSSYPPPHIWTCFKFT